MSKLFDKKVLNVLLEGSNDELRDICARKTAAMEALVREKVVIPYCKKHGYSFESGMGSWNFRDRDGEPFYPGESRHKVQDRPSNTCDPKYDADEWYVQAPFLVNAQVMKDIATWAASAEAKAVSAAIQNHCEAALKQDLVEADFKEFEARVAATTDAATIREWQSKLETALGVPHDLMERGRAVMATQMRLLEKQMTLGLEPAFSQMKADGVAMHRKMVKDLAEAMVLRGLKPPTFTLRGGKLNKSRSWQKNQKLGHHAERMASRWPTWHRRYKKWMRIASKCGVAVWGTMSITPARPVETIKLGFNLLPDGKVDFL